MKRVILTGANGFIGRQAIIPLVRRGFEVHAVSNVAPTVDLRIANVIWHQVDLLDPAAAAQLVKSIRATHLLHFAWYVEHGAFWDSEENSKWLVASSHLFNQFCESGGERIVASGTCVEYKLGDDELLSEKTSPLAPQSKYAESKVQLFKFLSTLPISNAWGRVFFLFGEYESKDRLVASVIRALLANKSADCSHGNQIRDFLHVKDVADAFVALLDSEVSGAVNIASGKALTIRNLLELIGDSLGMTDQINFGAIAPTPGESARIVADTQRLAVEVKWKPMLDLRVRIEETIEWWKQRC